MTGFFFFFFFGREYNLLYLKNSLPDILRCKMDPKAHLIIILPDNMICYGTLHQIMPYLLLHHIVLLTYFLSIFQEKNISSVELGIVFLFLIIMCLKHNRSSTNIY